MSLPHGQRQILDAIENKMWVTDPALAFVLSAFSNVTRLQGMPTVEQLAPGAD